MLAVLNFYRDEKRGLSYLFAKYASPFLKFVKFAKK